MVKPSSTEQVPPLIVHVINRLAIGGLENGLVNLINHMPRSHYRHAILCLRDFTDFRKRLRADVPVFCIRKRDGQDFHAHLRVWRLLRALRPSIIHTRNLPTMEYVLPAVFAGVPIRIHGEHGRDVHDDCGRDWRYQIFRRFLSQWIQQFTTVSQDIAGWLSETVRISSSKVTQIYNGVDSVRFSPRSGVRPTVGPLDFSAPGNFLVGTVGRMQTVKDQVTLVQAFLNLRERLPLDSGRARLILIGDGPLRAVARALVVKAGIMKSVWMPGERDDIPEIMRAMDLFVLPSQAEGISNTLLEAMASGLPVLATRVGGNEELVAEGITGMLVSPSDPWAMAESIAAYLEDESLVRRHGKAGRTRVEETFSLDAMVRGYMSLYDRTIHAHSMRKALPLNVEN